MSHFKINLICCAILLVLTPTCEASIITDAGFEAPNSGLVWLTFGDANPDADAPGIDSAIEGNETLQLIGNGDPDAAFTIALQDIPVDGVTIGTSYQVALSGILGHTSDDPLAGLNRAFLEVSFVDASGTEFMDSIFQSVGIGSVSSTDVYLNEVTSVATVPGNAVSVRLKAVFEQLSVNENGLSGAAFFDNLELTVTVPEPTSGVGLAAGLLLVFARRSRRRTG